MVSLNDLINGFRTGEAWYVIVAFIFLDLIEFLIFRMKRNYEFYRKSVNIGLDEIVMSKLFVAATFIFSISLVRAVTVNKTVSTVLVIIMALLGLFTIKNAQVLSIWGYDDDDDEDDDSDDEY